MTTMPLDAALATTYEDFNVPVDQFFGNQELTEAFATAIRARAGDAGLDSQEVMHRLLYLRKKGRLPRLRRCYYGRNFSNNKRSCRAGSGGRPVVAALLFWSTPTAGTRPALPQACC